VRTIEFIGPIGAGKSSVVEAVYRALLARGLAVSLLDELVQPSRALNAVLSVVFAARHPRLAWHAGRALLAAPIPWWHRRLILGLTMGVGGRLWLAARRVATDHWVLVDEGLVHRSVNLHAWQPRTNAEQVRRYLARVPIDGLVMVVNASAAVALRRATRRGLPKRLASRPDEEVARFAAAARDIVRLVTKDLSRRGAAVIRLDNQRSLRRAVATAVDAIMSAAAEEPGADEGPVQFDHRFPVVPRPDRVIRRTLARRSATLDDAVVNELASRLGLTVVSRPRSVTSPGGRGSAVRVKTADGEVLFKRYKPTLGQGAVRVEHSVLRELERQHVPAPRLVPATDGETCIGIGGQRYAAFHFLSGFWHPHEHLLHSRDRRTLETAAGEALGALHNALSDYRPPQSEDSGFVSYEGPRVRPVEWYADLLAGAQVPRRVRGWTHATLWHLWERLEAAQVPRGVIHGDYGPYNLLFRRRHPVVIIDFELARLDWRLVDLATALPRFAQRRRRFDGNAALRVLRGYRHRTSMSLYEARLIPDMLAFLSVQRAVVCWSRAGGPESTRWEDEARRRIALADDLVTGRHPLTRVVRA
jgi:Ser/Thr protein kinase RdoA (MazF antagonist)